MKTMTRLALLACVLLLTVAAIPFTAAAERTYIYGCEEYLSDDQLNAYNDYAASIYADYRVAVYFALTDAEDIEEWTKDFYDEVGDENGFCLTDNGGYMYLYCIGKPIELFTELDQENLYDAYYETESFDEAISSYLQTARHILHGYLDGDPIEESRATAPADAAGLLTRDTIPEERLLPRLVDQADILTDIEERTLLEKLDAFSVSLSFDIAVVTVDSLPSGYSATAYADDVYDYNGFGYGDSRDGALLLLAMDSRDWRITTTGYGITALTDARQEYMADRFLPYLSDGDYATGFATFADLCREMVEKAREGDTSTPKDPFNWLVNIPIALGIGLVIALIVVSTMKGKLKSVRFQQAAADYVRAGSLNVTTSRDIFLYAHVSRQARVQSNSSGGSSTHSGSSGTSHGGSGGKF